MKKITLLMLLALTCGAFSTQAQVWSENFNSGIPSNWITYNDANTPNSYFGTIFDAKWTKSGWVTDPNGAGDSLVIATSYFSSPGTADRWLVTPRFKVTSANMYLYFHYLDFDAYTQFQDSLQILVSTTDSAKSSFKTTLYNNNGSLSLATKYAVSLGAYNGQYIHIAFRDNSYNKYVLGLDNVGTEIPNANDMRMDYITPTANSPLGYDTINGTITLNGSATNVGYNTVSSFVVKYQQGTNTPVSQTITGTYPIYTGSTYSFNYTVTAHGSLPIKAWVEASGDTTHSNDTLTTTLNGVYSMPKKRLVFEEGTGTWCGWCVRGIVFMDSLYGTNPNDASYIAVHNSDPMTVTSYDSIEGKQITGYPSVVVDRREVVDPSGIINTFGNENGYFAFAKIDLTSPKVTGSNFTVTANVTPALDLSGDYRLALVLTEDNVHGSGTTWDQHNYYSSTSANQYLYGQGIDYQTQPNPIPSSKMYYKFVARSITPNPNGAAGSLPSSMTNGTKYSYNFTAPISASWVKTNLRAYVLLIRHSDGQILNSQEIGVNTGIQNIEAGVNSLKISPNPATNETYLNVELTKATNATVTVTDITGKMVYHSSTNNLPAGGYYYNIPTNNMPNGIYLTTFTTETGSVTTKFVVAH